MDYLTNYFSSEDRKGASISAASSAQPISTRFYPS